MKLAITGASGLIGANVVRAALAAGHETVALARPASDCRTAEALGATVLRADLLGDKASLIAALRDVEVLVHTAATFSYSADAEALHDIAVRGTKLVLEAAAAADVRRVVVTSSSVVFGHATGPERLQEADGLANGKSEPAYVAAKIAQDHLAREMGEWLGLQIVLACPTMTLGPTGSALGPSNGLVLTYLADPFHSTWPGGCNLADAEDVGAAHVLLATDGEPGAHYLLGGENLRWSDIHREIGRLTGVGGPRLELSAAAARLAAGAEEWRARLRCRDPLASRTEAGMLGRYYWYDDSRARALGYRPRAAAETLRRTVSWLVASRHVSRELRSRIRLADDVHRLRYGAAA